jgi:hypothetical protein
LRETDGAHPDEANIFMGILLSILPPARQSRLGGTAEDVQAGVANRPPIRKLAEDNAASFLDPS